MEGYVTQEAAENCVILDRIELPPVSDIYYSAFVDPSGGAQDSMTLAIAHKQEEKVVLDAVRERRPPFSPESVVEEFCELLERYRISSVKGDFYGGEWVGERFRKQGIVYERAEKTKSDLYRDLLPVINSAQVELLDNRRMVSQLVGLERRTSRAGKDSIDHGPGGRDDLINAVAGVVVAIGLEPEFSWRPVPFTEEEEEAMQGWVSLERL